jgi:uncharacterized delta-60 repeat protein
LVGGYVGFGSAAILVRYMADGGLDNSFDGDGKVVLTTPTSSISGLALQRDGKIVSAGGSSVTRFNSNGSLDTSFGSGGNAVPSFQPQGFAAAVAVQPDGKIVAGGSRGFPNNFALARFQQGGSLDMTFGSGGMVETDLGAGDDVGWDLGIAPDGKIVLAGMSRPTSDGPFDFAVVRYLAAPPPCKVPNVHGKRLAVAKASIKKARCRVGKVTRKASKRAKKGRVLSQSPRAGVLVPSATKVNLVVSKGRRR